jgi:hypothetical protein
MTPSRNVAPRAPKPSSAFTRMFRTPPRRIVETASSSLGTWFDRHPAVNIYLNDGLMSPRAKALRCWLECGGYGIKDCPKKQSLPWAHRCQQWPLHEYKRYGASLRFGVEDQVPGVSDDDFEVHADEITFFCDWATTDPFVDITQS